ncbi:MAG: MFS transporter [Thermoplasmata archaeon]|nr:MFS transporter [Thermoplasmata archaeon]
MWRGLPTYEGHAELPPSASEGLWGPVGVVRWEGHRLLRSPSLTSQLDFVRLLAASAFGFAGAPGAAVVLAWMSVSAYNLSAPNHAAFAAWALALLGISATVPTLVMAFFSGTLADRMNRRRLLRVGNALGLLGVVLLAAVFYVYPTSHIPLPGPAGFYVPAWFLWVLPLWALIALAAALSRPTLNSSIPQVVGKESLGRANGLILSIGLVVSGVGTLSVGFLLTPWGPVLTLLIPIAFLEVAAVSLATLQSDVTGVRKASRRSFASDMSEGLRYVGRRTGLLEITLASLGVNFFAAIASVEIPLYVDDWLRQGALVLGALTFVASLGTAIGSSAVNAIRYDRSPGLYLALFVVLSGLTLVILPFTHSPFVALAAIAGFGFFVGMLTTIYLVVIQRTVPNELLGRVFAADEIGSFALIPLGQSVGGALTALRGLAFTYWATGGGIALLGAIMAGLKELRRFAAGHDQFTSGVGSN